MAKYVEFIPDLYSETENGISVWWFPESFSQARLGDRIIGSNACTLIAVLLAGRIDDFRIQLWGYIDQPLTRLLVNSIAEAIVEGNELHEHLKLTNQLVELNLTVPEGLDACSAKYPNLTEWSDKQRTIFNALGESLFESLQPSLLDWIHHPPQDKKTNSDLYIVLVADSRSVLLIYQSTIGKITLIDSHNHRLNSEPRGCVVAQTSLDNLAQLTLWYCQLCYDSYGRGWDINPFELAFLYSRDPYIN